MEFMELIKTSKVEDVVCLRSINHRKATGTLCLTSHHILFKDRTSLNPDDDFMLMYTAVEHIERKLSGTSGVILLYCKDFSFFKFKIPGQEEASNVATSIELLSSLESASSYYPFFWMRLDFVVEKDGWDTFPMLEEYNKIIGHSEAWRISVVNAEHKVCTTYPKYVIVPKEINDDTLKMSAKFRNLGRFPVLSYLHKNKVPILRCSQPLVGTNNRRCKEDEQLLTSFLTGHVSKGMIVDTRLLSVINSHRSKGGGCETDFYTQWKRAPQGIEKPSHLGDTVFKLYDACSDTKPDSKSTSWLLKLDASGWMRYIESCVVAAKSTVEYVAKSEMPVIVHGEHGMDMTLLVTSLAQLMLDPDARTILGFEALIVREWIWGGHPFTKRNIKIGFSFHRKKEHAAVFLLFLDCVHQIINQYASSFEFNEQLLLVLAEHAYYSQYGTFLFNCEQEREQNDLRNRTKSLWSYLNREEILPDLRNPLFTRNEDILMPSVAPQSFVLWSSMFMRTTTFPTKESRKTINDIILNTKKENDELKIKAKLLKEKYEQLLEAR